MGDNGTCSINGAISNLTNVYTGTYWQGVNTDDFSSKLVYTGNPVCIKPDLDYGVTLNEDAVKEIVEKITKKRELAKITPDEGPEIPKWTGFLEI